MSATKARNRCSNGATAFFNVGIYPLKSALYRDLDKTNPEEKGYVSFPRGLPDSFFEELVCERRVPYKRMGVVAYRWEKPDKQANEMHDCFLYASAAAYKHGVNHISDVGWSNLRAELEGPPGYVAPVKPSLASQLAHAGPRRDPPPPMSVHPGGTRILRRLMSNGGRIHLYGSTIDNVAFEIFRYLDGRDEPYSIDINGHPLWLTVDLARLLASAAARIILPKPKPGPRFTREGTLADGRKIKLTLGAEEGGIVVFIHGDIRATGPELLRLFEALGRDVASLRRRGAPQQLLMNPSWRVGWSGL